MSRRRTAFNFEEPCPKRVRGSDTIVAIPMSLRHLQRLCTVAVAARVPERAEEGRDDPEDVVRALFTAAMPHFRAQDEASWTNVLQGLGESPDLVSKITMVNTVLGVAQQHGELQSVWGVLEGWASGLTEKFWAEMRQKYPVPSNGTDAVNRGDWLVEMQVEMQASVEK